MQQIKKGGISRSRTRTWWRKERNRGNCSWDCRDLRNAW
ncbi:hypothetical protein Godav_000529 [Gossypium davidsonii]|uniref:Uncharacterized protein n=1 Tax=Gossypium davidsonii TaxID=34287 RepID=A0A7J8SZW2_GOSDV|nr:hypothetical protein [Gossypium davidsonii]